LLNRGKRSIAIDLKADDVLQRLGPLLARADVIVEQYRPGVLARLGLGYEDVARINPRVIYASITGYGQSGPYANVAAHDLNFCAQVGLLGLACGADGAPVVPAALVGDIAGGAYPAILNILLALKQREQTGKGCYLDISMADNLFPLLYWSLGNGLAARQWPRPGGELVSGGSPRYNIYRTSDDRFIAAAPLEDKFWNEFCEVIGLEERDDSVDPGGVIARVAALIAKRTAAQWQSLFAGCNVCCNVVVSIEDALDDPHFRGRNVFARTVSAGDRSISALPVPVDNQFRGDDLDGGYPELGEGNSGLMGR
jgi:crotonobetainyl-CoA:carnitine CoA-transferase CaiB-like acyl-CoA transferase